MRRLLTVTLAIVVGATALSGCSAKPEVSEEAAGSLQTSVQQVAELAAAGDPTAALAELDALQATLDAAVDKGEVSEDRSSSIQSSIDLVRADLTTAVAVAAAEAAKQAQAAAEAQAAADAQAAAEAKAAADAQKAKDDDKKNDKKKPDKDD